MRLDSSITRLDHGLRIATTRMAGVESVAMGIWVGVGARHEPARLNGVSHFIEHLLFKGTRTRTARQISEAIEGRGGYLNAFTQEESTCYYARVASDHTAEVFEILADMYLNPRFAPDDIERERNVILEEISMYNDQPAHVAEELLGRLLWPGHPMGRPLAGTVETVRRIAREDLMAYKTRRYAPCNTLVLFAGDADHDPSVRYARKWLGRLRRMRVPAETPVKPALRQQPFAARKKEVEQTHIAAGFRIFGRHDPRRFALKLLSVILGENMSSRLFQIVREQHGLAYSIQSGTSLFADTGVLSVTAGVDIKRSAKAWRLITAELARLARAPAGAKELQRAKDYTIGQLRLAMENSGSQLLWVGEHLLGYGRIVQPEEYIRAFSAVTADDIRAAANAVFRARQLSVAIVSPLDDAAAESVWRGGLDALP